MVTDAPPLRVVAVAVMIVLNEPLVHREADRLIFSVPAPGRHHNVMYLASRFGIDFDGRETQGFLLSDGTFATREEALKVAIIANQIFRRCGGDEHRLYSENLW